MVERVCIVIPAFNDWDSAARLLTDLGSVGQAHNLRYRIIIMDDASTVSAPDTWDSFDPASFDSFEIARLACNLGHQRAIAVGLVLAKDELENCSAVIVMDGDGEDLPSDIPRLLAASSANPGSVVCARRARRSEPIVFRLSYQVYKFLFGSLTGTQIDFGNYCLIPKPALRAIVSQAGIWNHLAATLTRSRVPLVKIDTARGERYSGRSKMNFISLVVHGLTAVAVYADVALVRLVLVAMVLAAGAFAGIIATIGIRVATPWPIPGWASDVAGTLSILLSQAVLIPAIGVFVVLSLRTARTVVPLMDAKHYVESIRTIFSTSET